MCFAVFSLGGVGPLALAGGKGGGLEQLPTHPQAGPHPVPSLKGRQRPVPLVFIHCLCTEIGWERAHTRRFKAASWKSGSVLPFRV